MVREPYVAAFSASTMTCLISLMPERTAENSMKVADVRLAMIFASVVLPTPGGPQKMRLAEASFSIWRRNGLPGARRWLWLKNPSRVRGRLPSARGARWAEGLVAGSRLGAKRLIKQ